MILSVSRRTDIPAYFSEWFFNRFHDGRVMVRNPMNPRQVTDLQFEKEQVDGLVFWTKDPQPMLDRLDELENIPYYFQYTITPYGSTLEPGVPDVEKRIETLLALSERIGPDRIIWRYDPIILDRRMNADWHRQKFEFFAEKFKGKVNRCVISFLQGYRNTKKNMPIPLVTNEAKRNLALSLQDIAAGRNIAVYGCCETELKDAGIPTASCVDAALLSSIAGYHVLSKPATGQRQGCGCDASYDIGAYNTCSHKCKYCYANYNETLIGRNVDRHDPDGFLIYGEISERDRVSIKQDSGCTVKQIRLIE